MDVEMLSRLQFAGTVMFHYLFPPLTIGLGLVMVFLEGAWLRTGKAVYEQAARFWTKVFALNFALGVATGIVMEFEFGTNWAAYSRFVGDVFGSALAAEGIFAFFLESGFLAVLVFGWDRVGRKMHFFSTCMVFLGSVFSSIWIVIANSWQQTPAGYHVVPFAANDFNQGLRAEITDFWAVVFNPSTVDRLTHVWVGAFILGGFFVMSVSAYYILKNRHLDFAKRSFVTGLVVATVASLGALLTGHDQACQVAETQPAKLAAFEGLYETPAEGEGAPLYLFGWPDDEANDGKGGVTGLAIPGMLSYLIGWDTTTPVAGLDNFHPDDRPPVMIPFQTYHLMVGLGMLFIAMTLGTCFFAWRGSLWKSRRLLWVWVFAIPLPFVANQAGWVAAEVGRQPWIVYPQLNAEAADGVLARAGSQLPRLDPDNPEAEPFLTWQGLRTSEGLSEAVKAEQVLGSIILFGLIYLGLFAIWIYVLNSKIQQGPDPLELMRSAGGEGAGSLLSVAAERVGHESSLTEAKTETKSGEGGPR